MHFSLPPISYRYSRNTDSLGQVHRTQTIKWRVYHECRFSSCDYKNLSSFVAQISPSMTGDGWFSALQILTAVFASLLPAVLQIVVTSEAQGTWQSNEAVRLEGVYGWEIPKATSGPNVTPLQSSFAVYKRFHCFSSVFWTYFLSSNLHAQFTAVYTIWRLYWPSLKTILKLPENPQTPEERLANNYLL
jgi:hypothetical protein